MCLLCNIQKRKGIDLAGKQAILTFLILCTAMCLTRQCALLSNPRAQTHCFFGGGAVLSAKTSVCWLYVLLQKFSKCLLMRKELVEAVNARENVAPVTHAHVPSAVSCWVLVQFLLMSMKVSLLYFVATENRSDYYKWLKFITDPTRACFYPVTPVHKTQNSYF
jgi:hypothetical protein